MFPKPLKNDQDQLIGTLINPITKSLCPLCFDRYHLSECEAVATKEVLDADGKVLMSPNEPIRKAPRGWERFKRRFWVPPLLGQKNQKLGARWKCPRCGCRLPQNVELFSGKIIAIVGKGRSGKSHYIASLIHQLSTSRDLRDAVPGAFFESVSDDVAKEYQSRYYQPLYVNHDPIGKNQPGGKDVVPLFYRITVDGRSINLLFYDAAGEDIEDRDDRERLCRYILNASGIIYLLDPLNIDGIRKFLPQDIRKQVVGGAPEHEVIQSVIASVMEASWQVPNAKFRIPTVITLAKSDLLRYARFPNLDMQQMMFMRDASYEMGLKQAGIDRVSAEVEEVLRRCDDTIWQTAERFARVRYAAISATGVSVGKDNKFPFVQPRRCLDPLLWLLQEMGMIQAK